MRNNLEKIRKDRKIRQEQLAKAVGVSRQTIGSIENGRYNPSVVLAINIARYFGKKVEDIFIIDYKSNWLEITNNLKEKNENYKNNKEIVISDDLILNQNSAPWKSFKYGKFKIGFNGGELVAIYNVCKMLLKTADFADIILEFESNEKAILGGLAGTDPTVLGEYFEAHNIEYRYCTQMTEIIDLAMKEKVFIISYWVKEKIKELKGIHTVAGIYMENKFIIYNAINDSDEILEIESLSKLIKKNQLIGGFVFEK